jgi:hypothetical protein
MLECCIVEGANASSARALGFMANVQVSLWTEMIARPSCGSSARKRRSRILRAKALDLPGSGVCWLPRVGGDPWLSGRDKRLFWSLFESRLELIQLIPEL